MQCFGEVFDQHIARIKRIVNEDLSGCLVIFGKDSWPMIRFRVQDAQGGILSATCSQFTLAELEEFSDRNLRSAVLRLCELSK